MSDHYPVELYCERAGNYQYVKNILEISNMKKHVAWYNELKSHDFNEDTVDQLLKEELTHKFVNVLEDAGVFKMNEEGKEAFIKFVEMVGEKE